MPPDGSEVVATRADAADLDLPPLLVLDAVIEFLDAHGLGSGPVSWERIGDGHSNVTYRLDRGDATLVLRRGPRPPQPPSAHNMVREARIQQLVAGFGTPVPRILAVCSDESVLGVTFYIAEYLEGVVITDAMPAGLDSATSRRAIVFAAADALASLHEIDVRQPEFQRFPDPAQYLGRQVNIFSALWGGNTRREIPEMITLGAWLGAHLPTSQRAAVVHGDFRLGNLMFRPDATSLRAILDWEMATVGDPLADLGYFLATYSSPGTVGSVMELSPVTAEPGFPSPEDLLDRYAQRFDLDFDGIGWYEVLALWKSAVFCEAMYTRWLEGERPSDDFGPRLKDGVPQLVDMAVARAAELGLR